MPNSDDDDPNAAVTAILIGIVSGDYREFVEHMTKGEYRIPGDLGSIGICPGVVSDRAGLMLAFHFGGPNERVEVARVPYHALLVTLIHVTVAMHDAGILKDEPLGERIEEMMAHYQKTANTPPATTH